MDDGAHF
jgi:hypothetical protein